MAVDAASFKISIDLISPGLISAKGLRPKFSLPFREDKEDDSIGTPSITYRGVFPELSDELPLTLILIPPPGAPELEVTCTPAARPCKTEIGSCKLDFSISSLPKETMAPVTLRFFFVP